MPMIVRQCLRYGLHPVVEIPRLRGVSG